MRSLLAFSYNKIGPIRRDGNLSAKYIETDEEHETITRERAKRQKYNPSKSKLSKQALYKLGAKYSKPKERIFFKKERSDQKNNCCK